MRDHDHISLVSDDAFCPSDVWIDDPFAQERILDVRKIHGAENCCFKNV